MNERLLNLLEGNEDIYPHMLEEKFPRVFGKLLELWQTPHIDTYLQDLMVDKRAGDRQGFPPEAAMEIIRLSNYLHELRNTGKEVQAWDDIPEYKRHELMRIGYEFSPTGLLKSIEDNNQNAVQVFLSCGVDLEVRDDRNWTPLMVAAFNGNRGIRTAADQVRRAGQHAGQERLFTVALGRLQRACRRGEDC